MPSYEWCKDYEGEKPKVVFDVIDDGTHSYIMFAVDDKVHRIPLRPGNAMWVSDRISKLSRWLASNVRHT